MVVFDKFVVSLCDFHSIIFSLLQATLLHIVPPIAVLLAKNPVVDNYDLTSVKYLFCGAAPLGGATQQQLEARLKTVKVFQGQTQLYTYLISHKIISLVNYITKTTRLAYVYKYIKSFRQKCGL